MNKSTQALLNAVGLARISQIIPQIADGSVAVIYTAVTDRCHPSPYRLDLREARRT